MKYAKVKQIWDHTSLSAEKYQGKTVDGRAWIAPTFGELMEEIGPRAAHLGLSEETPADRTLGRNARVIAWIYSETLRELYQVRKDADEHALWLLIARPFGLEDYWSARV